MIQDGSPSETAESHGVDTKNFNFVQLSRDSLAQMRQLARKSPLAHEILYLLVEHMGRMTNAVVCSYATLQELTGVSRATVGRAIKLLKDDNWIDTVKIGNANAYAVNARVFWSAGRNQKRYAIFSATVIASASEQGVGFREKSQEKLRFVPVLDRGDRVIHGQESLPPPDQTDMDLT